MERGRGHRQAMRSNGMIGRAGGMGGRVVISLDKTLLLNKETEKEHLARCSKWEGVGKVMAGHHITTQMGEKEGRLSMCVFFLIWKQQKKVVMAGVLRDDMM